MQRLQQLQPEIKKIQERYKDDKQRMNQEVMAFYQREKVNPLGSCLPLLLQIPVLHLALLAPALGRVPAGHRQQPGLLAIDDLAEKVTEPVLLGFLIVLYVGDPAHRQPGHLDQRRHTQRRHHARDAVRVRVFLVNFPAG